MSIIFLDSFSWSSVPASLKYTAAAGALPLYTAGRYSLQALVIENTGFGAMQLTRAFGTTLPTICFSCSWRPTNSGSLSNFGNSYWLWFDGSDGAIEQPLLGVKLAASGTGNTTGKLEFYNGAGALLATGPALTLRRWYSLEIVATFGASGSLDVYLDDVNVIHLVGSINWSNTVYPDEMRYYWASGGPSQAGYSLCDVAVSTTRLGPVAVVATYPDADAQVGGWTGNGGTSQVSRVQDHPPALSPDGDLTYTQSSTPTATDLFTLAPFACFGLNLAVAPGIVARGTPGGLAQLVVRPDPTSLSIQQIGLSQTVPSSPFAVYQTVSEALWIDGDINAGYWGFRLASGTVRVTEYFVEKVTSLRNVPYTCGGLGPYSY